MVHTFEVDGQYYLFDVESSALHVCDALTAEVIKKMQGQPFFLEGADPIAVREIEEDVENLRKGDFCSLRKSRRARSRAIN